MHGAGLRWHKVRDMPHAVSKSEKQGQESHEACCHGCPACGVGAGVGHSIALLCFALLNMEAELLCKAGHYEVHRQACYDPCGHYERQHRTKAGGGAAHAQVAETAI